MSYEKWGWEVSWVQGEMGGHAQALATGTGTNNTKLKETLSDTSDFEAGGCLFVVCPSQHSPRPLSSILW